MPRLRLPQSLAVARPTHLRPVQSKADCKKALGSAALGLLAANCDLVVTQGILQLIWDESSKAVDGYKVYRVDGGSHQLLGTAIERYYFVKKPPEGYNNLCFAVEAYAGSKNSKDSKQYCYAFRGTTTMRSFKPSYTVTEVDWTAPPNVMCAGKNPLPASAFFRAADKDDGRAFTDFFPFLLSEQPASGEASVSGMYAGNEVAAVAIRVNHHPNFFGQGAYFCGTPPKAVRITAVAGASFDLRELAGHKVYSASLTLNASQTVGVASGKFARSKGGWCPIVVGAANREWWLHPVGNLTYNKPGRVEVTSQPPTDIDVTSIVSTWASVKFADNYGFIVASLLPPGAAPPTSTGCLTKFSKPSLKIVYF